MSILSDLIEIIEHEQYIKLVLRRLFISKKGAEMSDFTREDKKELLTLARETITRHFSKGATPALAAAKANPKFLKNNGVFVTLKKQGDLRGCIGLIIAEKPLFESIHDMALEAAFGDPRFEPLSERELTEIDIEISILTEPKEVSGYNDISIGRDGMILRYKGRSALFLPQVAPEQGWDLPTTLSHLAWKARLPQQAWKEPGAKFLTFQAEYFGEHDL